MIFGIAGLIVISFAIWFRSQIRQDLWFAIGGVLLLAYSLHIGDKIFIILQCVFTASAVAELLRLRRHIAHRRNAAQPPPS